MGLLSKKPVALHDALHDARGNDRSVADIKSTHTGNTCEAVHF